MSTNSIRIYLLFSLTMLMGCSGRSPDADATTRFMTKPGEYHPRFSQWHVVVDPNDRHLSLNVTLNNSASSTMLKTNWTAQSGWFVILRHERPGVVVLRWGRSNLLVRERKNNELWLFEVQKESVPWPDTAAGGCKNSTDFKRGAGFVKTAKPYWTPLVERFIGCVFLVTFLPMLVFVAFLIHITAGSPVILSDEVPNNNGTVTRRLQLFCARRVTARLSSVPWGRLRRRYRMDDFPALWSVARGDVRLREFLKTK